MKIKLEPIKAEYHHKFVIEFKGYYGDMDGKDSGKESYEVDSIQDSKLIEKLVAA